MSKKLFLIALAISVFAFFCTVIPNGTFISWLLFSMFVFGGLFLADRLSQGFQLIQLSQSETKIDILLKKFNIEMLKPGASIFRYSYIIFIILYSFDALHIIFSSLLLP